MRSIDATTAAAMLKVTLTSVSRCTCSYEKLNGLVLLQHREMPKPDTFVEFLDGRQYIRIGCLCPAAQVLPDLMQSCLASLQDGLDD